MSALPTVCILAGGLGTRLGERVADTPKPLVDVAGEPFLLHQLRLLARYGAERVVLCVGYLGDKIEHRIRYRQYGIQIDYSYDTPGLDGTLGAIRRAQTLLPKRFLVLYGDTFLRIDYQAAVRAWHESGCLGLMTVLRNEDRWDRSNAVYENDRVTAYDKTRQDRRMRWIDYGLGGLDLRTLDVIPPTERDLPSLYGRLAQLGELCGYEAHERFYEIGTPEGLSETEAFLRSELPAR